MREAGGPGDLNTLSQILVVRALCDCSGPLLDSMVLDAQVFLGALHVGLVGSTGTRPHSHTSQSG